MSDLGLIALFVWRAFIYDSTKLNAFVVTYWTLSLRHSVITCKIVLWFSPSFPKTSFIFSITYYIPFSLFAQALAKTKQATYSPNIGTIASAIGFWLYGKFESFSSSYEADTMLSPFKLCLLGSKSSSPTVLKSRGFFILKAGTIISSFETVLRLFFDYKTDF